MELLWAVVSYLPKKVEHGIEHDVLDSPYGVCIHYTFLKFTIDSLNEYLAI